MLPKLKNCIDAIENGVSRVHILDGRILHCLLLEIFTNKGIGTAIFRRREENTIMKKQCEYQSRAEQVVLHTYNRFPCGAGSRRGRAAL